MSRSVRKHPFIGFLADSDKECKVRAHRRLRRCVRRKLHHYDEELEPTLMHEREAGDPWTWAKDGKWWLGNRPDPKWMRK